MSVYDFIITVLAAVVAIVFGWALTIACNHPTVAICLFWFSAICFAALGAVWATYAKESKMAVRILVGASTVTLGAVGLAGALSLGSACAQSQPEKPPIGCSNSVGGNNSASLSNNCGNTYNLGPPRMPNGLYQSGEKVGAVSQIVVSGDKKSVILTDLRITSAETNFAAPIELQGVSISCPMLVSQPVIRAAQVSMLFVGETTCDIVAPRS